MSPVVLPSGGPGFPVGMSFPQILGIELQVHSPAQDAVLLSRCSLLCLFPPSSPLLMLLTHSMGIVLRDMPHPDSPTSSLGELENINLWVGYKVHNTLENKGPQSRPIRATITVVKIVFHHHPSPRQDRSPKRKIIIRHNSYLTFHVIQGG